MSKKFKGRAKNTSVVCNFMKLLCTYLISMFKGRAKNNSVICNFMKRFCTYLISMALLNQISFETKQKSKYKVDFNFIFISIKKYYF